MEEIVKENDYTEIKINQESLIRQENNTWKRTIALSIATLLALGLLVGTDFI